VIISLQRVGSILLRAFFLRQAHFLDWHFVLHEHFIKPCPFLTDCAVAVESKEAEIKENSDKTPLTTAGDQKYYSTMKKN
jgi:hypothetical protein